APDKLLLTKFDETNTFGDLFNLRKEFDYPFSYITYGQDVPDDIEEAVPQKLTEFLLGDLNE
ncbi:MAG: flagellar biosynthesis protein FlhF, partial [Bacillota bacterium]